MSAGAALGTRPAPGPGLRPGGVKIDEDCTVASAFVAQGRRFPRCKCHSLTAVTCTPFLLNTPSRSRSLTFLNLMARSEHPFTTSEYLAVTNSSSPDFSALTGAVTAKQGPGLPRWTSCLNFPEEPFNSSVASVVFPLRRLTHLTVHFPSKELASCACTGTEPNNSAAVAVIVAKANPKRCETIFIVPPSVGHTGSRYRRRPPPRFQLQLNDWCDATVQVTPGTLRFYTLNVQACWRRPKTEPLMRVMPTQN
jgi:hypothetical protein